MTRSTVPHLPEHVRLRIASLIDFIEVLMKILPDAPPNAHPLIVSEILNYSNLLKDESFLLTGQPVAW